MKSHFKFTIARKLFVGFGIVLVAVITNSYLIYNTLDDNLKVNALITNVYTPSSSYLNELYSSIVNSKMLIKNWVFIERKDSTEDKRRLVEIHKIKYPRIREGLKPLVTNWNVETQNIYFEVTKSIDTLFDEHQQIMSQLNSLESYNDLMKTFEIQSKVEQNGAIIILSDKILGKLNILIKEQEAIMKNANLTMEKSFGDFQKFIFWMAMILFLAILIIAVFLTRALVGPINAIKQIILLMGKGILPEEKIQKRSDEIGEMADALGVLIVGLRRTSEFALKIGEGEFSSAFKPMSDQDVLGNSLVIMRSNLKKASEEAELRKIENNQRSWAAQGLAKFGELLRESTANMEEFSYRIISNVVKYLEAQIGGLYILNDTEKDDIFIELSAFYAYDRRKYVQKRIELGEGLIGQCVRDQETYYLTDIPEDYVHIVSGLGDENPRSILIVPLKVNDVVFGVIELASFSFIEKYQIEFVEKISESIASTISSVRINLNTARLLEESHEKSERLAKQEEEVRLKIEEMQRNIEIMTYNEKEEKEKNEKIVQKYEGQLHKISAQLERQEENFNREKLRLQNTLTAIGNSWGSVELSIDGKIISANVRYQRICEISTSELIGKPINEFVREEIAKDEEFQKMWKELQSGMPHSGVNQYFFAGKEKWFFETFTPIKDENEKFYKIIVLSSDITSLKEKEKEMERKIYEAQNEIQRLRAS